jgi:hypothetical protein
MRQAKAMASFIRKGLIEHYGVDKRGTGGLRHSAVPRQEAPEEAGGLRIRRASHRPRFQRLAEGRDGDRTAIPDFLEAGFRKRGSRVQGPIARDLERRFFMIPICSV